MTDLKRSPKSPPLTFPPSPPSAPDVQAGGDPARHVHARRVGVLAPRRHHGVQILRVGGHHVRARGVPKQTKARRGLEPDCQRGALRRLRLGGRVHERVPRGEGEGVRVVPGIRQGGPLSTRVGT